MAVNDFNPTYWTMIGAVAPVIALAAIVSLNDLWRQTDRVNDETTDTTEFLWLDAVRQLLPPLQLANVVLQAYVLWIALLSIAWQRNVGMAPFASLGAVTFLEVCGLLVVGVGTAGTAFLRYQLGKRAPRATTVLLDESSIVRLSAAIRGHEPDPPHPAGDPDPA